MTRGHVRSRFAPAVAWDAAVDPRTGEHLSRSPVAMTVEQLGEDEAVLSTEDHEHVVEAPEVVVSIYVLNGMEPVRMVIHHDAGDWSVLCGTVEQPHEVVGKPRSWLMNHPELGAIARAVRRGWMVTRDEPGDPWLREPAPPDLDE